MMTGNNGQHVSRCGCGWRQALGGATKNFCSYFLFVTFTCIMLPASGEAQRPLLAFVFVAGLDMASSFLKEAYVYIFLAMLVAYTWYLFKGIPPLGLTGRELLARTSTGACIATGAVLKRTKSILTEGPKTCSNPDSGLMRPSLVQHTSLPTARLEPVTQPDTTCGLASQSPPVSPEADCPSHCSSVSKEAVCCQDGEPAAAAEGLALLPAVTLDCKTETTAPADSPLTETASPKGPSTPTKLSEATCRAAPVTPASSKPADNSLPAGIKTTMSNVRYLSQKFERQELDQTGIQRADIDSEIVGLAPIDNSANGGAMSYNRAASGVARSEMNVKNSGKSAKLTPPAADSLAQVSADIRGLKVEFLDGVATFVEQVDELLAGTEYDGELLMMFGSWQLDRYRLMRNAAAARSNVQCLSEYSKAILSPSYRVSSGQPSGSGTSLNKMFDAVELAVSAISTDMTKLMWCSKEADLAWNIVYKQQLANAAQLASLKLAVCDVRERCLQIFGRL